MRCELSKSLNQSSCKCKLVCIRDANRVRVSVGSSKSALSFHRLYYPGEQELHQIVANAPQG